MDEQQEVDARADEVQAAYKAATERHDRERLLALCLYLRMGLSPKTIGEMLMRGAATIERWVKAFREGGIPGLLARRHKDRVASLSEDVKAELIEGLKNGRWQTAGEIQRWLEETHQVKLKDGGVRYWIRRLRGSLKVPQTSHVEKKPEEAEAFKKEIDQKLAAVANPKETKVYVWVEDEHRYGLNSVTRRVWTLKGWRPVVPYQKKREYADLYGAMEVGTGMAEFLHVPSVSLEWTEAFLKQLVARDPEGIHVVIWDEAGWHPLPDTPGLPEQIRILPLPARSPELNPAEGLWPEVKKAAANINWETLGRLESAINVALKPFWESAERVWRLLGHHWTTRAVARFLGHPPALITN